MNKKEVREKMLSLLSCIDEEVRREQDESIADKVKKCRSYATLSVYLHISARDTKLKHGK